MNGINIYESIYSIINNFSTNLDTYELRMPFQNAPVDYEKGYLSYFIVNEDNIATPTYTNTKVNNNINVNISNVEYVYLRLECERVNNVLFNKNPVRILALLKSFFNSLYSAELFKNEDLVLYPCNNSIQSMVYYLDKKKWIQKATLDFAISYINNIDIQDVEFKQIQIIKELII